MSFSEKDEKNQQKKDETPKQNPVEHQRRDSERWDVSWLIRAESDNLILC